MKELKDILHYYLPYKLKCQLMGEYGEDTEIPKQFILSGIDNDPYSRGATFLLHPDICDFDEVFPLLIPLSKLTEEFLSDWNLDLLDQLQLIDLREKRIGYWNLPLGLANECLEKHIDIFGLIPQNSAIEKMK